MSISTPAGSPPGGTNDATGASARFANPWGVAVDGSGNVYVADTDNNTIRRISAGGTVTTLAGQPGVSGSANGTGSGALFNKPQGVAVDALGNVYVCDTGNNLIRKVTSAGVVSTLAGVAGVAGTNDGPGTSAHFSAPQGIVVNTAGSLMYIADTWNHTIRKISLSTVSTLVGSPGNAGTNDGTGGLALFNQPQGLAIDSSGFLYVGDTGNHTIRRVTSAGGVTTLAGTGGNYGATNATGKAAAFWGPQGLAADAANNLYVADSLNHVIRKVTPSGVVTTFAGTPGLFGSVDATGAAARFWLPQGVAMDSTGVLYVADSANGTIRKIASGAVVTTLAGSPSAGSTDGPGASARFAGPSGAAMDSAGNSYLADTANGTIRKVSSGEVVSTVAGAAGVFGSIDGPTNAARFAAPQGVALDGGGNLYVADTANHTIRKITPGGTVSVLAGSTGSSGPEDGAGAAARFNSPQGVAVDAGGNVYVADTWNHTIRKVTAGGVVTTLAGSPGFYGSLDDGGPGNGTNQARFYCPSGVAVDGSGNVYVADTRNHTVRKVTPGGTVSTLAGRSGAWGDADGTNNDALFNLPQAVTVDAAGNLFVVDAGNHALREVSPVGTNWVVTTVAGAPTVSGSADGPGNAARFLYPAGIAMNNGAFAVADWGNNTLRGGVSAVTAPPSIVAQPQDATANQGQSASFSVAATGAYPLGYQWRLYGTNLSGATASTYAIGSAQPANAGPYAVVVTNSLGSITSMTAQLTVVVPPTLASLPQSQTVNQYSNATFTVSASGTEPSYQWLFNGASIASATASSFTKVNVQPGDAGNYSVVVYNAAGSTTSPPATLTVSLTPAGPSITTQPQSQSVVLSSNATFSVAAMGTTPLAYQWRFYGTNLDGATASSYTVADVQNANGGPYAVFVSNAYGNTTSAPAMLTVLHPPIISLQPQSQLVSVSNSVTFTVGLSQGASPAYQWQENGSPIAGATQSSYTIASAQWADAGTYAVVVTNSDGSAVSAGAQLTVQQAPLAWFDGFEDDTLGVLDNNWSGPNATSSNAWWSPSSGTQGSVLSSASGVSPHGGAHMAGRSGSGFLQDYVNLLYRFNEGQPYYGNFLCDWWFYDPYGTASGATSYADYVALGGYAPVSTSSDASSSFTSYFQRLSLGAYNGGGYNVNVYQARLIGGAGDFGSANSWYNTATPRTAGWHHARVVFGIPSASNYAPVWMYIDNMTNAVVYSPTSGTNTGINLIEMNHANASSGYYDDITFRADNDPWIVEQPLDQAVNLGQSAYFNTVAIGTAYQWRFNGTNIAGATTSAYSIPSVASTNGGVYACLVSGTNGTLSTSPAVLSILDLPASAGRFSSLARLNNGLLQLGMNGTPYTNYILEYTSNWTNWTQLSTLSGPTGSFQFTDPTPATNVERFYRLRVAPYQ